MAEWAEKMIGCPKEKVQVELEYDGNQLSTESSGMALQDKASSGAPQRKQTNEGHGTV